MSHPIDTRQVMEQLTDAGVPPPQAKAHTVVLFDSLKSQEAEILSRACSKHDLVAALEPIQQAITELVKTTARVEAKTDTGIARLEAKIDATNAKVDSVKGDLKGEWITWLLAFGLLQTALVGGVLFKLLP